MCADFEAVLTDSRSDTAKKRAAAKNYNTQRSNLGFKSNSKSSKHSVRPSSVLSEDEKHVLQSNGQLTAHEKDLLGGRWVS